MTKWIESKMWAALVLGATLAGCGGEAQGTMGGSGAQSPANVDLAATTGDALSEGINTLCAVLEWNDEGAAGRPPVDAAALTKAMAALDAALGEVLSGRVKSNGPPISEADRMKVRRLEALAPAWPSAGHLSAETMALAEDTVKALTGGTSWKDLMKAARSKAGAR